MSGNLCMKHKNFHVKLKRDTEYVRVGVCACVKESVCARV